MIMWYTRNSVYSNCLYNLWFCTVILKFLYVCEILSNIEFGALHNCNVAEYKFSLSNPPYSSCQLLVHKIIQILDNLATKSKSLNFFQVLVLQLIFQNLLYPWFRFSRFCPAVIHCERLHNLKFHALCWVKLQQHSILPFCKTSCTTRNLHKFVISNLDFMRCLLMLLRFIHIQYSRFRFSSQRWARQSSVMQ